MTSLGVFTSEVAVNGVVQVGNAVPGAFRLINSLYHSVFCLQRTALVTMTS